MDTTKEDIKPILVLVKKFLPTFVVARNDLLKLNSSFVITFYSHWVHELANRCHQLLDYGSEDVLDNCAHDIDKEMFLFLFVRNILNKIGVPYFTLCDFYRPSNRTRTTMKICLNFLFYIEEMLPASQEIVKSFKKICEGFQLAQEGVHLKKEEVSETTYRIGLLREDLEQLSEEYDKETLIQSSPECDNELRKDIEQLEKELESLSSTVTFQEQRLNTQKKEIEEIEDQVVSEDHEMYKKDLQKLQKKIKDYDYLISKNEVIMEEKYKTLEYINELAVLIQEIDLSAIDNVEEIDNLKQKFRAIQSNERDRLEKKKMIEICSQKMSEADINFHKDIVQIEKTLSDKNGILKALNPRVDEEVHAQKQLVTEYQEYKDKHHATKINIMNMQIKQDHLENECKKYYQRMLACLERVTQSCNDVLNDMVELYRE